MAKKLMWANVHVPQYPRVRFYKKSPDSPKSFIELTQRVAKLVVEDLEDSGQCELQRLDENEQLVWKTRHPSLQETKWYVEFEYGLPEEKWNLYNAPSP